MIIYAETKQRFLEDIDCNHDHGLVREPHRHKDEAYQYKGESMVEEWCGPPASACSSSTRRSGCNGSMPARLIAGYAWEWPAGGRQRPGWIAAMRCSPSGGFE
jgi:hypothetical protein